MTIESLAGDEPSKKYIEELKQIYDIDDDHLWLYTFNILEPIYNEIAYLAAKSAPEELTKDNRPSLMEAALRFALEHLSTETKADLEQAQIKVITPVTSTHFMNTLHKLSHLDNDNPFVSEDFYSESGLETHNNCVLELDDEISEQISTFTPVPEHDLYAFIEALNIVAASKVESFLAEYRGFLYLSSPDPFAGMNTDSCDEIQKHYVSMFDDAIHCARLLHASKKDIEFQIKRSTQRQSLNGTHTYSISVTPIDPASILESKSFDELIDNIRDETTTTREGVVSNGQVALQVIVKREFIEDTTRRG